MAERHGQENREPILFHRLLRDILEHGGIGGFGPTGYHFPISSIFIETPSGRFFIVSLAVGPPLTFDWLSLDYICIVSLSGIICGNTDGGTYR